MHAQVWAGPGTLLQNVIRVQNTGEDSWHHWLLLLLLIAVDLEHHITASFIHAFTFNLWNATGAGQSFVLQPPAPLTAKKTPAGLSASKQKSSPAKVRLCARREPLSWLGVMFLYLSAWCLHSFLQHAE